MKKFIGLAGILVLIASPASAEPKILWNLVMVLKASTLAAGAYPDEAQCEASAAVMQKALSKHKLGMAVCLPVVQAVVQ